MDRVHQRRSPPGKPIMVSMTRIPGGMLMLISFPHDSATTFWSVGGQEQKRRHAGSTGRTPKPRLILASSAPEGVQGMHGWAPEVIEGAVKPETSADDYLGVFFAPSDASKEAGR
jgi:hypothetical protein